MKYKITLGTTVIVNAENDEAAKTKVLNHVKGLEFDQLGPYLDTARVMFVEEINGIEVPE